VRKRPNRSTLTPLAPVAERANEGKRRESGHILLVNDDPRSFKMIASLLGADYEVSRAGTLDAAMEILDEGSRGSCCAGVDTVILDAAMGGMSGFELCRRLRANPATSELPVAIVTSVDSLQEKVRAIEAGADDLIGPPIDQIELQARVRSLVRVSRLRRQLETRGSSPEGGSPAATETAAFARLVAHDLRGPLAGILGNAQLLQAKAGSADPSLDKLASRVLESARQMQVRLSDILDVSLFEMGQRPLKLDPTNVRAAAAMVIEEYREYANTCEVALELEPSVQDPDQPVGVARADAGVLLRIFGNLVATSLKHTPAGGTIRIVVREQTAGKVEVHVADTGDVMCRDDQDSGAANAPVPANAARAVSPIEKNLALRYCRLAVEAHGGRLWLEQNAAGGNTFGFVLPAHQAR